jgi:hypothetical protein
VAAVAALLAVGLGSGWAFVHFNGGATERTGVDGGPVTDTSRGSGPQDAPQADRLQALLVLFPDDSGATNEDYRRAAQQALDSLRILEPQLTLPADSVVAAYVREVASGILGQSTSPCASLRQLLSRAERSGVRWVEDEIRASLADTLSSGGPCR